MSLLKITCLISLLLGVIGSCETKRQINNCLGRDKGITIKNDGNVF